jgi:hypothetical protein
MRGPGRRLAALFAAGLAAAAGAPPVAAAAPISDWAGVVVAGDDASAHSDTPTEAFDNARRDVTAALIGRGFSARNLAQFSLHPDRYPADHAAHSEIAPIARRLRALADTAPGGCLVYITSHGSPDGVVVDDRIVPPAIVNAVARYGCGARPTAVVISACFSGVFIPALAATNRLVFTAARRDRSSFGCGESDRYPFFDGCVIEDLPAARDFIDLADRVKACVADREDAEGMRPRSQPQLFVGRAFRAAVVPFDERPIPERGPPARP